MSISKLHYFSKNTDATASLRGYKYQELKTLESWISNKINDNGEIIYCEYEEDIFQSDPHGYKVRFRQIKLYSSNFSFSSIEVKKALFHFFMLYSKGDYILDNVSFVFETNSNIARRYPGNNAEILKEWAKNKSNLSTELFSKIHPIVKEIIDGYILNPTDNPTDIDHIEYYKKLPIETWQNFLNKIEWLFNDIEPEKEIERLSESISNSLYKIPSPLGNDYNDVLYVTLLKEISEVSIQNDPNKRALTIEKFDEVVLNLGDKYDKWYLNNFKDWQNVDLKDVQNFHLGWFLELLHSAEFCRRFQYADNHSGIWMKHINNCIETNNIPELYARRGYYELVYSTLKPHKIPPVANSIDHLYEGVKFYFETIGSHTSTLDLENAKNLLLLIFIAFNIDLFDIEQKELDKWILAYEKLLRTEIKKAEVNTLRKCALMQSLGFHIMIVGINNNNETEFNEGMSIFKEIVTIQEDVPSFTLIDLSNTLDEFIGILVQTQSDKIIQTIEEFNTSISQQIIEREGELAYAKSLVNKGIAFLKSKNTTGTIKSINYFHKAKDIFNAIDSFDNFVLSLLNISQFYSLLDLQFASKYYSLCSTYVCFDSDGETMQRKISDSLSLSLIADFSQGSWFGFLQTIPLYLNSLRAFNFQEYEYVEQQNTRKIISTFISVCAILPQFSNQYIGISNYFQDILEKAFGVDSDICKNIISENITTIGIDQFYIQNISGNLINDSSNIRTVIFNCFEIKWSIVFDNTYMMNSIGEEFISILQIHLGEILLSNNDFHLIKSEIELNLFLIDEFKDPIRRPNNNEIEWEIYLTRFSSKIPDKIYEHYVLIGAILFQILSEISLLPKTEFDDLTMNLYKKQSLSTKVLSVNSYQYIYEKLFSKQQFEEQHRDSFNSNLVYVNQNSKISSNSKVSDKFDLKDIQDKIVIRYTNCTNILSKSLPIYVKSPVFIDFVKSLRNEGYLDWQILFAITNVIVSLKSNQLVRIGANEDEEVFVERIKSKHIELMSQKSEEDGIYIPVQVICDPRTRKGFEMNILGLLKAYGLESRAKTPILNSIRELLQNKYKFNEIDVPHLSPFNF